LDLYPDHPAVLNYLGYSWIDQGINVEEGLDMIERAVAQRANDGNIVDSLGWAYYRLGDYEEAVIHLERAVQLLPSEAVINDHLGDAYWKVGRYFEARYQWGHALTLEPEEDLRATVEEKLEKGLDAVDSASSK
jgi:Flp pilus assembly protein TadD